MAPAPAVHAVAKLGTVFQRYFLPGLIFQSVLVGGGYATGRELVEFFLAAGPWTGLLGMCVAAIAWSVVLAVSFEFARVTGSYDYRSFFRALLGRGWVLFEAVFALLVLLVLSVLGAAAGALVEDTFSLPALLGTAVMMALVGMLAFYGSQTIAWFLAAWSFVLYAAYAGYFALWAGSFGDDILANFRASSLEPGWLAAGVRYAGYNTLGAIAVLFSLRRLTRRRETLLAGALAGPLAMFPGILFFIAMVAFHPEIGEEPVPVNFMLNALGIPALQVAFQIVLFGTFIETGLGLVHSVNERVADLFAERGAPMPRWLRPGVAVGLLVFAIFLAAKLGVVALVASGYRALSYAVLAVFVLPVLTLGLRRILYAPS